MTFIFTFLVLIVSATESTKYRILSLDSAKYGGLLTAEFVSFLELKAYSIANRDFCFPLRRSQRIAMPEIFDMIVGSETGAIIASSLVIPNDNIN